MTRKLLRFTVVLALVARFKAAGLRKLGFETSESTPATASKGELRSVA